MISITYNQIIPRIRSKIIDCLQIDGCFVRDAADVYGSDLDMKRSNEIFTSIARTKCLVLFSLYAANDENDVSMQEDSLHITRCQSYTLKLILYGDESTQKAYELLSKMLTAKSRSELFNKGILIKSISNPETIKEFKNGSVWLRADMNIEISCEHSINVIDDDYEAEVLNTLTIKGVD